MKENYYNPCSPCGDVTNRSEYQTEANGILSSIFCLGKSKEVQEAEQSIRVEKITNTPVNYFSAKALYEIRTMQDRKVASPVVQTSSPRLRKAIEFDPWTLTCADPPPIFAKRSHDIQVPGTDYLAGCDTCNSKGYTPCSCGNGRETCYTCGGNGKMTCGNCGGSGKVTCGRCSGDGYIVESHYRGYDASQGTVSTRRTCSDCGGDGWLYCGRCNGAGKLTCSTCGGKGDITCRKCGGTTKLTCNDCSGHGHFLHTVHVLQEFDVVQSLEVLDAHQVDVQKYHEQKFPGFCSSVKDTQLYSVTDTTPLYTIPLERILPAQHAASRSVARAMSALSSDMRANSVGAKYVRYGVEVYQRDVLEVTYQFQEDTYHLLSDRATDSYLMDKNPYGNVAASLLKKLEGHYKNGELRSFRDTYDEFSVVSGADNITLGEANAKPMMKKIKAMCFAVPAVVAALVSLLLALVIPGWTTWLSVASGAASVGLSVLIAYLTHMRLMLDKKHLTYGILAGFGVVISVVLRVVIGLLL